MPKQIAELWILVLVAVGAGGAYADADADFRAWVRSEARARKMRVHAWGPTSLGAKSAARIAELRFATQNDDGVDPTGSCRRHYLVAVGSARHVLTDRQKPESHGMVVDCELFTKRRKARWKRQVDEPLEVGDKTLTVRRGRLVVVREKSGASGGRYYHPSHIHVTDWDRLTFDERDWKNPDQNGKPAAWRSGAIILVLADERAPTKRTWQTVIYGKKRHRGDADASLAVRAVAKGSSVDLLVDVTDDVRVPLRSRGASDRAFLAADHLELWFRLEKARHRNEDGEEGGTATRKKNRRATRSGEAGRTPACGSSVWRHSRTAPWSPAGCMGPGRKCPSRR